MAYVRNAVLLRLYIACLLPTAIVLANYESHYIDEDTFNAVIMFELVLIVDIALLIRTKYLFSHYLRLSGMGLCGRHVMGLWSRFFVHLESLLLVQIIRIRWHMIAQDVPWCECKGWYMSAVSVLCWYMCEVLIGWYLCQWFTTHVLNILTGSYVTSKTLMH
jgi:hypothetical protein